MGFTCFIFRSVSLSTTYSFQGAVLKLVLLKQMFIIERWVWEDVPSPRVSEV